MRKCIRIEERRAKMTLINRWVGLHCFFIFIVFWLDMTTWMPLKYFFLLSRQWLNEDVPATLVMSRLGNRNRRLVPSEMVLLRRQDHFTLMAASSIHEFQNLLVYPKTLFFSEI